jgi:hypothetical protein
MTSVTTHDFRFPEPDLTRVFKPHPDDSTIPQPNINPPTLVEAQYHLFEKYRVLKGSI